MDVLGSILGSMDKPPQISEAERQQKKKQRELALKHQANEKEMKQKFREKIEERINAFLRDGDSRFLKFETMDKFQRSIVHDVADVAGLVGYSFGEEDVDRYMQVWKKEFAPCEGELSALRRGEEWDPVRYKQLKEEEEWKSKLEEERSRQKNKIIPKTNYQAKYEHLIGKEAALGAARKTEANKTYGMVSAESKKDKRTVEQVQAELRAKKKRKLEDAEEITTTDLN